MEQICEEIEVVRIDNDSIMRLTVDNDMMYIKASVKKKGFEMFHIDFINQTILYLPVYTVSQIKDLFDPECIEPQDSFFSLESLNPV